MKSRGFTLIELIMVISVVAVLAFVALPRFFGSSAFDTRGYSDQLQAALRYAQKSAIAKRRNVCVGLSGGTLSTSFASSAGSGAACDTPLAGPDGASPFGVSAPSGVAVGASAASFTFDALGRVAGGASVTFTVSGEGSRSLRVEGETGYVHEL